MKTVFVVDDNNVNLLVAEGALSERYDVFTMLSAPIMFEILNNIVPDIILLDIMMPDIDGFAALKQLKADPRYEQIPVIFLTIKNDADTEALGFEMGVVDFITKPFSGPVLLNRIRSHLHMEAIVRQRTDKLLRLQKSITSVLANIVENRDKLTGRHIERTAEYIKILINSMLERGVYADEMKDWDLDGIVWSGRLHDIGKIIVSDLILNKSETLTDEEYEIIKTHAIEGERIIDDIMTESGDDEFLKNAKIFASSHHERWDGKGYPRGLKGADIPLLGRIMAIADVYDALVSRRPYKEAFTHEKSVEIILENSGLQFDPQIVEVFMDVCGMFAEVDLV